MASEPEVIAAFGAVAVSLVSLAASVLTEVRQRRFQQAQMVRAVRVESPEIAIPRVQVGEQLQAEPYATGCMLVNDSDAPVTDVVIVLTGEGVRTRRWSQGSLQAGQHMSAHLDVELVEDADSRGQLPVQLELWFKDSDGRCWRRRPSSPVRRASFEDLPKDEPPTAI